MSNHARSKAVLVVAFLFVGAVVEPTLARAGDCDPAAVAKQRSDLEHESHRLQVWRYAWAIGFGAGAIAQGALAEVIDDHDQRAGLWVGAIKSSIGALSRLVLPVRVTVPAVDPDVCVDGAHLRAALDDARRAERAGFWLNHIGGFLVNAAGTVVLAHYASWKVGLLSFAVGYPIGLASTYTMPRWAWHATPIDHGAAVGVSVAW